jgi:hydroxymethylpyrimidine pyrophosphatase-like HAD family hydrolase
MEWIHKTNEHLEQMTDDKLGIYISALKQQVKELEDEKYQIFNHPRNADVSKYSNSPENMAYKYILKEKTTLQEIYSELNRFSSTFEYSTSKKQILDFVKNQSSKGSDLELENYFLELLSEKWRF